MFINVRKGRVSDLTPNLEKKSSVWGPRRKAKSEQMAKADFASCGAHSAQRIHSYRYARFIYMYTGFNPLLPHQFCGRCHGAPNRYRTDHKAGSPMANCSSFGSRSNLHAAIAKRRKGANVRGKASGGRWTGKASSYNVDEES